MAFEICESKANLHKKTFLRMDPEAFKRVWPTILKLGLVPWAVEAAIAASMLLVYE